MSDFAAKSVEGRVTSELIGNAIEEHLLLEFTFDTVLKSLLREPGKPVKKSTTSLKHT